MIEINLNPSAKQKKSRTKTSTASSSRAKFDIGASLGNLTSGFKDPWLGFAIAGIALGAAAFGWMFYSQGNRERDLTERERVAVQDSAKFAGTIRERAAIQAQRDSINRQIEVIKSLDGSRFIWPHILDEVSRALPTYTWLTNVAQTNRPAPVVVAEGDSAPPPPPLALRVIGHTVDVQALTVFMKNLEASPFLTNVQLVVSEAALVDNKAVTAFTLDLSYAAPPASQIRTVPLTVAVR